MCSEFPYEFIIQGIHMIGDKWLNIRNNKKKGLSYSEIARKYNIDRRTAKNTVKAMSNLITNTAIQEKGKLLSMHLILMCFYLKHHTQLSEFRSLWKNIFIQKSVIQLFRNM